MKQDGLGWYANKPIGFLVEKLLKEEFAESDGELPDYFVITKNIKIQTADSIAGKNSDNRVLSVYGRPPELSAGAESTFRANKGSDKGATWLEKGLICRAICCWNFGTNTDYGSIYVNAASDNATTVHLTLAGSDVVMTTQWGDEALKPV